MAYEHWLNRMQAVAHDAWPPDQIQPELQRHQVIVEGATPDSDFSVVAISEAAIRVLTRHLEPARHRKGRRIEEQNFARDRSNELWARYWRLRDISDRWPKSGLTGPDRDTLARWLGKAAPSDDLAAELVRLVGAE